MYVYKPLLSTAAQPPPPNRTHGAKPAVPRRMLMTAVHHHMDSSSSASPPPWLPTVLPLAGQHFHDDFTALPASASAPSRATIMAPPPSNSSQHLLPRAGADARRVARRRPRPRPSRRVPTTYISADPASFRRMVHQVTGADDLTVTVPLRNSGSAGSLVRPAPVRVADGFTTGPATLLPTLDTSAAFLIGAHAHHSRTDDAAPSCGDGGSAAAFLVSAHAHPRTDDAATKPSCGALPPAPKEVEVGAGRRACNNNSSSTAGDGGGFFPTLESSWDHHALF